MTEYAELLIAYVNEGWIRVMKFEMFLELRGVSAKYSI